MYHSQIRLCETYMKCSYMYITYNIGISKHEKHLRLLSSGTKLFITFEFKGSSTEGERYTFFLFCFFSSASHLVRHLPKASASKRKSTLLVRCPVLNSTNFLQNSPNPSRPYGAWRHSHLLAPFAIWAIVTSLSDTSAPHARMREHLC